jgi:ATP-dependent DNA helicase DinG
VSIGASPINLGPALRSALFDRVPAIVCTSATLTTAVGLGGPSFHFAKARLGAPPEAEEIVVPSPFDFEQRAALYVAGDLPDPQAPAYERAAIERIAELVAVTGGGAFVLCTSTRAMKSIHRALVRRVPGALLVQGEAPKHALLSRFRAAGNAVLVATMSFWEGVDVPGRALRLVILDKVPFPVPTDPIVAARCAQIERDGGNPFVEYSIPSAALTLKQGFGRLLRTQRDAGIVAILDSRVARRGYGRRLLASLPPARRVATVAEVGVFWRALSESEA